MKRRDTVAADDNHDWLSNTPDDIIDYICTFCPSEDDFLTLTDNRLFRLFQRCVRLSGVSRYYLNWFKRSVHAKELSAVLIQALDFCDKDCKQLAKLFHMVERSSILKSELMRLLCMPDNILCRVRLFHGLKYKWSDFIHTTHEGGLFFGVQHQIKQIQPLRRSMDMRLYELCLAFYEMVFYSSFARIQILTPTATSLISELMVYEETRAQEETPETAPFYVTLHKDVLPFSPNESLDTEKRLDIRLLVPFKLSSANNYPNLPVYRVTNNSILFSSDCDSWARITAQRIRSSQRLRAALVKSYHIPKIAYTK